MGNGKECQRKKGPQSQPQSAIMLFCMLKSLISRLIPPNSSKFHTQKNFYARTQVKAVASGMGIPPVRTHHPSSAREQNKKRFHSYSHDPHSSDLFHFFIYVPRGLCLASPTNERVPADAQKRNKIRLKKNKSTAVRTPKNQFNCQTPAYSKINDAKKSVSPHWLPSKNRHSPDH